MTPLVALPGIMPLSAPFAEQQTFADSQGGWLFTFAVTPQGEPAPQALFLERVQLDDHVQVCAPVESDWVAAVPVNGYHHHTLALSATVAEFRAYRGDTIFRLRWKDGQGALQVTRFIVRQTFWVTPT
jgi:hypothetical protein